VTQERVDDRGQAGVHLLQQLMQPLFLVRRHLLRQLDLHPNQTAGSTLVRDLAGPRDPAGPPVSSSYEFLEVPLARRRASPLP
jgi:hypothetical protein